jgi:hypothetical protein
VQHHLDAGQPGLVEVFEYKPDAICYAACLPKVVSDVKSGIVVRGCGSPRCTSRRFGLEQQPPHRRRFSERDRQAEHERFPWFAYHAMRASRGKRIVVGVGRDMGGGFLFLAAYSSTVLYDTRST